MVGSINKGVNIALIPLLMRTSSKLKPRDGQWRGVGVINMDINELKFKLAFSPDDLVEVRRVVKELVKPDGLGGWVVRYGAGYRIKFNGEYCDRIWHKKESAEKYIRRHRNRKAVVVNNIKE